jgi:hypothetical protein
LELEPVFERPETILEVADDEISAEKVVTEVAAAAAAAAAVAAAATGRDAGNAMLHLRAIDAMMDGSLEQRRKGFLLGREPWMDATLPEDMSVDQIKALREWDIAAAAAVTAKAKHHIALEAELRQLRADAADIVTSADARVERLHAEYVAAAEAVAARELRITRLLSSARGLGDVHVEREAIERALVAIVSSTLPCLDIAAVRATAAAAAVKSRHEHLASDDAKLDRSARRDFGDDDSFGDALVRVLRNRTRPPTAAARGGGGDVNTLSATGGGARKGSMGSLRIHPNLGGRKSPVSFSPGAKSPPSRAALGIRSPSPGSGRSPSPDTTRPAATPTILPPAVAAAPAAAAAPIVNLDPFAADVATFSAFPRATSPTATSSAAAGLGPKP